MNQSLSTISIIHIRYKDAADTKMESDCKWCEKNHHFHYLLIGTWITLTLVEYIRYYLYNLQQYDWYEKHYIVTNEIGKKVIWYGKYGRMKMLRTMTWSVNKWIVTKGAMQHQLHLTARSISYYEYSCELHK